jgi:hypothetical protein
VKAGTIHNSDFVKQNVANTKTNTLGMRVAEILTRNARR